jgi:quercetin dioxygenase-like cupin family protein
MNHYKWEEIEVETLKEGLTRQVVHCDTITIARIGLAKGAIVPRHSHPNEQVSTIVSGRLHFILDDVQFEAGAGESVQIPGDVPHEVRALEDSQALDVFSPAREDWRTGNDAYLRKT